MGKKLEATLAILNGAIGDYLDRTGNGLATDTSLVPAIGAEPVRLEAAALAAAYARPSRRIALFVHGLMCTETIWQMVDGSDYGSRLAADLGYSPAYLRYNSGLAIAGNGARLSATLDALCAAYPGPIDEIVLVGYSMGGLVVRSACHVARLEKKRWLANVRRAIYVGTPHRGAPLERMGRAVAAVLKAIDDPYTRLIGDLADLRSDGVKDLGDADLRQEDRGAAARRLRLRDPRHPVPLLPEIQHFLVAGSLSEGSAPAVLAALFGDALVPVHSATDGLVDPTSDVLPPSHVKILAGLSHLMLASDLKVYEVIRGWCE
jgi:pimeloyl-ACP methyl ester carboxylesterase